MQRNLDRLKRWAGENLTNNTTYKLLQPGQGKHKYRLCVEWIEITPEEKDLWMFMDKKLDMT